MSALMVGAMLGGGGGLPPRALASGAPITAAPQPPEERAELEAPRILPQISDGTARPLGDAPGTYMAVGADGLPLARPTPLAEAAPAQLYTPAVPDVLPAPTCVITGGKGCQVVGKNDVLINQTWYSNTVYVIFDDTYSDDSQYAVIIPEGVTVMVEAGTTIKIFTENPRSSDQTARQSLVVRGGLNLLGTASLPITFTSYFDDAAVGSNNDYTDCTKGTCLVQPSPGDFRDIRLKNSNSDFHHAIVRYGFFGVRVQSDTATPIAPAIYNTTFQNNVFGLVLHTADGSGSTGDINSAISNCIFDGNVFGLGSRTTATSSAAARPILTGNTFERHTEANWPTAGDPLAVYPNLPIFWNGSAYPTYSGNVFADTNKHLAIGLGGAFNGAGTWPLVKDTHNNNLPYLVMGDLLGDPNSVGQEDGLGDFRLKASAVITVPAGAVIKFLVTNAVLSLSDLRTAQNPIKRYVKVFGNLDVQGTAMTDPNRIVFTSYRDDTYGGDTNADTAAPQVSDYTGLEIYTNTVPFDYSLVQYAERGVSVISQLRPLSPTITYNTFRNNKVGLDLYAQAGNDITSPVLTNTFDTNQYGVIARNYLGDYPWFNDEAVLATLVGNTFTNTIQFPIYLAGTAAPHYNGNVFTNNAHPGIALGGVYIRGSATRSSDLGTWELVPGGTEVPGNNLPYVVIGLDANVIPDAGKTSDPGTVYVGPTYCGSPGNLGPCFGGGNHMDTTIHVPATALFKFKAATRLFVDMYGDLDLQSTTDNNRIVFTSYKDDVVDDTNNDGAATQPARGDWLSVTYRCTEMAQNTSPKMFDYALVKYSQYGANPMFSGIAAQNFYPTITHNRFEENNNGTVLEIMNAGDINSDISLNTYISNTYGLRTILVPLDAQAVPTGISRPNVYSNTFQAHTGFPIYLSGTGYPVYDNTGGTALNSNAFVGNLHLAVALSGDFRNSGTLEQVRSGSSKLPYVVVGDLNLAALSTMGLKAGQVVKFETLGCANGPCGIFISGELNVQGTVGSPVVFTSYKDDSAGGDTNGDGAATQPARGNWWGVFMLGNGVTPGYVFQNAVIKYATRGLAVRNDGNTTIGPPIANCVLTENEVGVFLKTFQNGNITSSVRNSIFSNNTEAVRVTREGGAGVVLSVVQDNDLYGDSATGNGLVITNTTGAVITATSNYWGHASGPYHPTLNPSGAGVSINYPPNNTVILDTFDSSPNQSSPTYSVQGRVSEVGDSPLQPLPIVGVRVALIGAGVFTVTNQLGNYAFGGLPSGGSYVVQPLASSYAFVPVTSTVVLLGSDASEQNFTGSPRLGQTFAISGTVLDLNDQPLSNVLVYTVQSSSGIFNGDFTKADGTYTFNIPNGTYTLVAAYPNKTFTPLTRPVTVNNSTVAGQDFHEFSGQYLYLPLIQR